MQAFLYVETNVFALVVLLLIFINIHHQAERRSIDRKLFLALLCSNAIILILDSFMWVLDGKTGPYVRELYLIVTMLYYVSNPVICVIWSIYADYQIFGDEDRLKRILIPMLFPVLINTVLAFFSMFGNYLFYIDAHNVYHRGSFFYIMVAISYLYLASTLLLIIVNRNKIQKLSYIPILLFAFPPFIGGIVQVLYYGFSLIWICMTISILIIFINLQRDQLYTDHLTGLSNRRQLDYYVWEKTQSNRSNGRLGGIMIDIDSFKAINDLYGHIAGDQALKAVADILKDSFRKNDFIARYGGDEFIIILEIEDQLDLTNAVDRLNENLERFNAKKSVPYLLSLSIGVDSFDCESKITVKDFMKRIDRLMYNNKMDKKA